MYIPPAQASCPLPTGLKANTATSELLMTELWKHTALALDFHHLQSPILLHLQLTLGWISLFSKIDCIFLHYIAFVFYNKNKTLFTSFQINCPSLSLHVFLIVVLNSNLLICHYFYNHSPTEVSEWFLDFNILNRTSKDILIQIIFFL